MSSHVVPYSGSAPAGTTTTFLEELKIRMPVSVQAIQVDGGSEFMAGIETDRWSAFHNLCSGSRLKQMGAQPKVGNAY